MLLSAGFLGASAYELEGLRDGIEMPKKNIFWTDDPNSYQHTGIVLDADCRDLGNVGTTTFLRSGLLLHRQASNDQYIHHIPGVYGHHRIDAILMNNVNMLRYTASGSAAAEKKVVAMIAGRLKLDRIFPPQAVGYAGSVTTPSIVGDASEFSIRNMLAKRFTWQDRVAVGGTPWFDIVTRITDLTLTADDHNFLFSTRGAAGAVVFTLPAPKRGLTFYFYNAVGQTMTVTSAEGDNIIAYNEADADSVSLETASELIGGMVQVVGDGTGWLAIPYVWDGQTATLVD